MEDLLHPLLQPAGDHGLGDPVRYLGIATVAAYCRVVQYLV